MKPNKLTGMIGLCRKAGKAVCGTPLVCEALRKKIPPALILLAEGASAATQKKIRCKAEFYHVPLETIPLSTGELATAVGKSGDLAVMAVTDENFAKAIGIAMESTGKDEADNSVPNQ